MIFSKPLVPILLVASFFSALAGASAQKAKYEEAFITINSDRMEADNKNYVYIFTGNVVSERGDYIIKTDRLEVFNKKDQSGIDKIVAVGNVRIIRGGRSASGDRAVYYEDEAKIVLTGNARAWEGDNLVTGEEMTLYLNEDRSIVKGGKSARVNATIYYRPKKGAERQTGVR